MKKNLFIITALLSIIGTVSYAAMPTEKDIGPCTARNAMGFCSESKTHYCADFGPNGRCTVWYSKSKSTYENAVNQINSFDEAINKAVEKQNKIDKPINDKIKQEFPILDEITNTRIKYEEEMNTLSKKRNLGVTVDENRINLLYYKTCILKEMEGFNVHMTGNDINGVKTKTLRAKLGIQDDYRAIVKSLNNKVLNENEFNEAKSKIVKEYELFVDLYNKLIALNTVPDTAWQFWLAKTYFDNSCGSKEKTSVEKINNGLNNGVNMLNNTMNNVRVIKGIFGKY